MKMKWLLSLLACAFLFVGCTSYDKLDSPSLAEFRDGIGSQFPDLVKLD
ncbi:hypothetical protein DFQ01_12664 [Paenibacillus cellulosilyticus]|uniref:Uncharacterized protein n=1 Tax=Paenibacillus cellulosilyticus TaxID=375489 RepID=A0A2V2YMX5_9BACL|nr:hypothetical protein DFQ01_12664 [Paenibacillus cellulosilyticus]